MFATNFLWHVLETTVVHLTSNVVSKGVEKAAQPMVEKAKKVYADYTAKQTKKQEPIDVTPGEALSEMRKLGKDNKDL